MGNRGRGAVGGHHVVLEELEQKGQSVHLVDEDALGLIGL